MKGRYVHIGALCLSLFVFPLPLNAQEPEMDDEAFGNAEPSEDEEAFGNTPSESPEEEPTDSVETAPENPDNDEGPEDSAPPTPELRPPSLLELAPMELPEGTAAPEGPVRVLVEIDAAGNAQVAECDASEAVCSAVREGVQHSRFEPAYRGEDAIPARVQLALDLAPATEPEPVQPAQQESAPVSPESAAEGVELPVTEEEEPVAAFGAGADVEVVAGNPRRLELEEMRTLPGALGDPFRAVETLPGVLQALSGLPFIYVRGAPPAGTLYFYDDLPLPALFHLGFGPAVVHPTMVGPIQLHSGVAPARYGRAIGGVIVGEGPPRIEPGANPEGELELRLIDAQGSLRTRLGNGSLSFAGRYGYPGLFLSLAVPGVDLAYWDYQVRFDQTFGDTTLELVALGSFDRFRIQEEEDDASDIDDTLELQFHRIELRLKHRFDGGEVRGSLRGGYEVSGIGPFFTLRLGSIAPRLDIILNRGPWQIRTGFDFVARSGGVDDLFGALSSDGQELIGNYSQADVGLYVEAAYRSERLEVELGLRTDAWLAGQLREFGADPRLRVHYHPNEEFTLHAAVGVAHQPAVAPIPLPGLSRILVSPGLQRAVQGEAGIEWKRGSFSASAQGFVHRMFNVLASDLVLTQSCPREVPGCPELATRRDNLWSYGMEVFIRRDPSETVSGFLSYTLARATIDEREGAFRSTPNFDIRHNLNAVVQVQTQSGFFAGARLSLRSGAPAVAGFVVGEGDVVSRLEERFPLFHRLDISGGKVWRLSWGTLRLTLELINSTFQRQPTALDCEVGRGCRVRQNPIVWVPNIGVRAAF